MRGRCERVVGIGGDDGIAGCEVVWEFAGEAVVVEGIGFTDRKFNLGCLILAGGWY